ncbi:MAG: beta-galactosidase [Phycisphaerae bacterium]
MSQNTPKPHGQTDKPFRYPPVSEKCPHMLHGADYNPDQWPKEVWDEDMRLMRLAGCNVMSVGIFSWVHLEPAEGEFRFDWLDDLMDKLADNGAFAALATPSAAAPAWLSAKYPETLRVNADRRRSEHGRRVNYCLASPLYREKVAQINRKLAERYADHPALLLWHVSNEYSNECHCELCQQAFRDWLKRRYGSLDALNHAWWTAFWGHTYTDWSQINSPAPRGLGENSINGLSLDWKRFTTDQTIDFFRNEIGPLREITPDVPVTTNCMGTHTTLNYWRFAPEVDVMCWDAYPMYHDRENDAGTAVGVSFVHDIYRTMKGGQPWLLMETTPSSTNWMPVMKLKRPGVHRLTAVQAIAHGADGVQYFQWRKSRGGTEKLHGAVVDHGADENHRVFKDVADVGELLARLDQVVGTTTRPEVAVLYDWENRWAIDGCAGPRREGKDYQGTCERHYRAYWSRGIPVDVVNAECDLSDYKLLIAPMLYMVRDGLAERLEQFVADGGTLVTTYISGWVNDSDLCFREGFPGPLRKLLGLKCEELDVLYDDEHNRIVPAEGNSLGLDREYQCGTFCDLINVESAEVQAVYGDDFYAGRPAVTANSFGKGTAWYLASRNEQAFVDDFHARLIERLSLRSLVDAPLPEGVTVQARTDGQREFLFLMNFSGQARNVRGLGEQTTDLVTGKATCNSITLEPYGVGIVETARE